MRRHLDPTRLFFFFSFFRGMGQQGEQGGSKVLSFFSLVRAQPGTGGRWTGTRRNVPPRPFFFSVREITILADIRRPFFFPSFFFPSVPPLRRGTVGSLTREDWS